MRYNREKLTAVMEQNNVEAMVSMNTICVISASFVERDICI